MNFLQEHSLGAQNPNFGERERGKVSMDYFSNKLIQALLQENVLQNLDKIGQELRQFWTKLCKHKNIHNV